MQPACLIQIPFMCGDGSHPARDGPSRCTDALGERLAAAGVPSRTETVRPVADAAGAADPVAASWRVNRSLAGCVARAVVQGELPLVFAGSCDASLGVLAGVAHGDCGVVWVDAHADFNTPDSSASGFFPGMALAVVTGHCHRDQWASIGDSAPVPEAATVLAGVRDVSPLAEQERLERSALHVVPWADGRPLAGMTSALDALAERVSAVYLHLDLDALDPGVAPGVVDDPVPGGLDLEQAEAIVRGVHERFEVRAAAVTTYVPERDESDRTLQAAVGLTELLATKARRV